MTESGKEVTLAGCALLDFDDDGVTSPRECWEMQDGTLRPPSGWGT